MTTARPASAKRAGGRPETPETAAPMPYNTEYALSIGVSPGPARWPLSRPHVTYHHAYAAMAGAAASIVTGRRWRMPQAKIPYLPDLHAYLDDLLRTRERLLATTDLDHWARTEGMQSNEEIRRIRRLIDQISQGLDELEPVPERRQQLQQAVTVVRRHRSVMLGMPRTRQTLPDLRPERTT